MSEICAAAEYLREGGPRTVPFRVCCVAVILRAEYDVAATRREDGVAGTSFADGVAAIPRADRGVAATLRADDGDPFLCAAMDLTIPADAASIVAGAGVGQPT
jgi:hypothetical protein